MLLLISVIVFIVLLIIFLSIYFINKNILIDFIKLFGYNLPIKTQKTEPKINQTNQISLSYKTFNETYNMNYYQDRIYTDKDLLNMSKTEAFVLNEPEEFDINIYEKKIKLYTVDILYKLENTFYENEEYLILFGNDFTVKPYSKLIKLKNKGGDNKFIYIRTPIISYRRLDRGDYIPVYYESNKIDCRIAPPFLEDRYVYKEK
jgi:hypothetical protein